MAANHDNEPELIETVITELDQSTFALALVGGAVIGGFLLYLFLQREKYTKDVTPKAAPSEEDQLNSLAERVAERIVVNIPQQEDDDEGENVTPAPWSAPGSANFAGSLNE